MAKQDVAKRLSDGDETLSKEIGGDWNFDIGFARNDTDEFTPQPGSATIDLQRNRKVDVSEDLVNLGDVAEIVGFTRDQVQAAMENRGPEGVDNFI